MSNSQEWDQVNIAESPGNAEGVEGGELAGLEKGMGLWEPAIPPDTCTTLKWYYDNIICINSEYENNKLLSDDVSPFAIIR